MARGDLAQSACPVARAVERVGEPWTLMILRELFLGSRRFDDLQRHTGASPHILSERLKQLCADDVLRRVAYSERPLRHEYLLTDKGRDLWPVIMALRAWGQTWLSRDMPNDLRLFHKTCGAEMMPHLTCPDCGAPIHARDCRADLEPEMKHARTARRKT